MPRLKRRQRIAREHSQRTRLRLLTGHDYDFLGAAALGDDDLLEAWQELRCELMEQHQGERPGSRPWAWWENDAPEPRRRIKEGGPCSFFRSPATFGIPSNCDEAEFESERDYLARLGLLTAEELEALASRERPCPT
jgi:hypothetical protein